MRRLLGRALLLAAVVAAVGSVVSLPGSGVSLVADAFAVTTPPIDDTTFDPKLRALLREYTVAGDGIPADYLAPQIRMLNAQDASVQAVLERARIAAAVEPEGLTAVRALRVVGRVSIVGSVLYGAWITYKVARTHPDGTTDFITRWIGCFLGDCGDYGPSWNPAAAVGKTGWAQVFAGGDWFFYMETIPALSRVSLAGPPPGYDGPVGPTWVPDSCASSEWLGCVLKILPQSMSNWNAGTLFADPEVANSDTFQATVYGPNGAYANQPGTGNVVYPGYTQAQYRAAYITAWNYASGLTLGTWENEGTAARCSYTAGTFGPHSDYGHCWRRRATTAQMLAATQGGELGEPNVAQTTNGTINYTIPADNATGTKLADAKTIIKASPATVNIINGALDPTWTVSVPDCTGLKQLPCVDAIRAAGLTGAVSFVTLTDSEPGICGACVVRTDPGADVSIAVDAPIVIYLNPGTAATQPLVLPQPLPNETAEEYLRRLREMGWVGLATVSIWAPDLGAFPDGYSHYLGPGEPALITVGTTTIDRTLGAPWPLNPPVLAPGDAITIEKNPTTDVNGDPVPVVAGSGSAPTCSCPAVDMSPLTSADVGNKFPFGIFGWAADFVGQFNVTPQAPDFAFNAPDLGSHTTGSYDVNLGGARMGWLDTYMGYWRAIISVALWVGAVWFVGSRLLNIETGDPGGATDELL